MNDEGSNCSYCCFCSPPVRWGLLDFTSVSSPPPSPPSPSPSPSPRVVLLHVGSQLRSCEFSVACWTPTAILRVQCGVPDPNRDPASSVWRAGPHLWSREFSAVCRTSTAIPRVQCGVPDPNCDHASSVWRAGPQLWWKGLVVVAERVCQRSSCKMSQDKSDRMSEDLFARSSERMCQKEWSKICQECQKILLCLKEPYFWMQRMRRKSWSEANKKILMMSFQERGNSIGKKLFCPKLGMPRKRLMHVWNCLLCGNVWKYFSCRKICAKRSIWFHQMRIVSARLVAMHVPSCRTAWRCRSMCAIWRRNWSGTSTPMVVPRQRRKPSRMPWMQMQKKIQGCSVKALAQQELVKNLLNRPLKMHWILISMARCDSRLQMHRWKFTTN